MNLPPGTMPDVHLATPAWMDVPRFAANNYVFPSRWVHTGTQEMHPCIPLQQLSPCGQDGLCMVSVNGSHRDVGFALTITC